MKTCKVYKMMVYARSISHMNQNDGFSKNLDSIKCFHQCLTRQLHSGRANLQNEFAHDFQTLCHKWFPIGFLVSWAQDVWESSMCGKIRRMCDKALWGHLVVWRMSYKGVTYFFGIVKILHHAEKYDKNIFFWFWDVYLFGDHTFIKWIMPNPL